MTLDSRFCDGYLTIGRRGTRKSWKQAAPAKSVKHVSNLFHAAVEDSDVTQVKLLLKYGTINLEELNGNGRTALQEACLRDDMEILRLLVNFGACLETRDKFGWTVLHYAAFFGNLEVVRLLILNCVDLEAVNSSGETALDLASTNEVKQLLMNYIKPVYRGQSLESDSDSDSDFVDESRSNVSSVSTQDSLYDSGLDSGRLRDSEEEDLFELEARLSDRFSSALFLSNRNLTNTQHRKRQPLRRKPRLEERYVESPYHRSTNRSSRPDYCYCLDREGFVSTLVVLPEDKPLTHPSRNKNEDFFHQRRNQYARCTNASLARSQCSSDSHGSRQRKPSRPACVTTATLSTSCTTREKIQNVRSSKKRMRLQNLRRVRSESDVAGLTDDSAFRSSQIKKMSNTEQLNLIGD